MKEFVVAAQYEVKDGASDALLQAGVVEAKAALANERGCKTFEILESTEGKHKGLFYEIYEDEAAYQEHRKTPHYFAFFSAIEEIDVEWTVNRYRRFSESA